MYDYIYVYSCIYDYIYVCCSVSLIEAHVVALPPADNAAENGSNSMELCCSLLGFKFVLFGVVLQTVYVVGVCPKSLGNTAHVPIYKPGKMFNLVRLC